MTRKHFNELAEILRDLRPKRSKIEKALWDKVVVGGPAVGGGEQF